MRSVESILRACGWLEVVVSEMGSETALLRGVSRQRELHAKCTCFQSMEREGQEGKDTARGERLWAKRGRFG